MNRQQKRQQMRMLAKDINKLKTGQLTNQDGAIMQARITALRGAGVLAPAPKKSKLQRVGDYLKKLTGSKPVGYRLRSQRAG